MERSCSSSPSRTHARVGHPSPAAKTRATSAGNPSRPAAGQPWGPTAAQHRGRRTSLIRRCGIRSGRRCTSSAHGHAGASTPLHGVLFPTLPHSAIAHDYIRTVDDEVARALSRDSAYDMDSEDEEWLIQLKHGASDRRRTRLNQISYEDFEKLITVFEKDAYNNPEEATDVDQLLSRHPALGKGDNVLAIHEYWINKRDKKGTPLLRIFQGAPAVRRGRLSQKSSVKKKRSVKRPQRSQPGRGKPGFFLQGFGLVQHHHRWRRRRR